MRIPTKFGTRFKELREEARLNQVQVAEALNIIKQTVSRYEKNQREPEYHDLIRIADFFNVSLDYLLGRTDER